MGKTIGNMQKTSAAGYSTAVMIKTAVRALLRVFIKRTLNGLRPGLSFNLL
jgi:hypothetical protein